MISRVILLFLISFFVLPVYSGSLKVCYEASLFIKVGESCIAYNVNNSDILKMKSSQYTTGLVDMVHRLEQEVKAEMSLRPFESIYLFFYEKNNRKTFTHHYFFNEMITYAGNSFRYKDSRYKSSRKKFKREGVYDPAAAVIFIQLNDLTEEEGRITSFFEGKYVDITYRSAGRGSVEFEGWKHNCRIIDFKVPVSTSSLVTPSGVWRIYIDEVTGIIMRLELQFPLGRAKLTPTSISGDRELLRKYMAKKL